MDDEEESQKSAKSSVSDDDRPKHLGFADKLRKMSKHIIPMPTIDDELDDDDGATSRHSDSFGNRTMKGALRKLSMTQEGNTINLIFSIFSSFPVFSTVSPECLNIFTLYGNSYHIYGNIYCYHIT